MIKYTEINRVNNNESTTDRGKIGLQEEVGVL